MTTSPMSPPRVDFLRRAVRWFLPMAIVTLAPKCLLCLTAYAGLGAALGFGGPEICGASASTALPVATWLAALIVAAGLGAVGFLGGCRRLRYASAKLQASGRAPRAGIAAI